MDKKYKNTRKQGDAGLGKAIAFFASRGDTVCIPLTDSQKFDLIVDVGGILKRVQVKTTSFSQREGTWTVMLKTCGGNHTGSYMRPFDKTTVDLLFVSCKDGSQYLIPSEKLSIRHTLTVGKKYAEYKV